MSEIEILCIDDASTDATYEVLLSFEKQYPEEILVVHLEQNGRQGAARNIGLSYASGEYISFLDADDYVETDMLKLLYEYGKKYHCDMVCGRIEKEENGKKYLMPNHLQTGKEIKVEGPRERMELLLHGNSGGICPKIYKREMLMENELFFPQGTYYEDNFWLPLACMYVKNYYVVDKIVYHYVDNGASTVNQRNEQAMADRMEMEVQKLGAYAKRGFLKEYYIGIEAIFARSYYIDTLVQILALWGEIPENYYEKMCQELTGLFPRCRENFMLMEKDKKLLETAFSKVDKATLEKMVREYAAIGN